MALADEIRQRLIAPTNTESVLTAKATGKQQSSSAAPRASTMQQKVAEQAGQANISRVENQAAITEAGQQQQSANIQQQLQQGMDSLASKRRIQEQAMNTQAAMETFQRGAQQDEAMAKLSSDEQMKTQQLTAAFDQALNSLKTDKAITEESIFNQYARGTEELEMRQDGAELEQLAFALRMRDQQYVDQLQRVGKVQRLENNLQWREEMSSTVLGAQMDSFLSDIDFKKKFYADQRSFDESLATINPEMAMSIAQAAMKDEQNSMIFQGLGTAGAAAAKGYFSNQSSPPSNTGGASSDVQGSGVTGDTSLEGVFNGEA